MHPANQWGWSEVFQNKIAYLLEIIAWQNATPAKKGEIARHKRNKPKPFVPDFMKGEEKKTDKGAETHTVDDIKSILALPRG